MYFLIYPIFKHNEEKIYALAQVVHQSRKTLRRLPSVVIAVADNQLDSCQSLNNDGFIYFLEKLKI